MKKILIIVVLLLAVIAGGLWYGYYRVLPKMVGQAIVEGTEPSVLPKVYQQKIHRMTKPVNRASEKIIHEIDSLHIPFEAIIRLIDETDNQTVVKMITELNEENPSTPAQIFNIVKKNVPSPEFDLELLRKPFLKYATMERYAYGMRYIENNDVVKQIDDMPYREIIKEVLIQKRAEIARKLKAAGGPHLK
jgi:hypothetical protein